MRVRLVGFIKSFAQKYRCVNANKERQRQQGSITSWRLCHYAYIIHSLAEFVNDLKGFSGKRTRRKKKKRIFLAFFYNIYLFLHSFLFFISFSMRKFIDKY